MLNERQEKVTGGDVEDSSGARADLQTASEHYMEMRLSGHSWERKDE